MKEIKTLFALGLAVLFIIGIMIIRYAEPSQTVDFRGEIHSVVEDGNGGATICAASWAGGDFLFHIDRESKIEHCCGEEITLSELKYGTKVDISYRDFLFKKEDVHTIKLLTVYD